TTNRAKKRHSIRPSMLASLRRNLLSWGIIDHSESCQADESARSDRWSSLRKPQLIEPCPVGDGSQSLEPLTESVEEEQLAAVRECLNRQRPFGKLDWQAEIASRFGLGSTLRPRGRPRSEKKSSLSPL